LSLNLSCYARNSRIARIVTDREPGNRITVSQILIPVVCVVVVARVVACSRICWVIAGVCWEGDSNRHQWTADVWLGLWDLREETVRTLSHKLGGSYLRLGKGNFGPRRWFNRFPSKTNLCVRVSRSCTCLLILILIPQSHLGIETSTAPLSPVSTSDQERGGHCCPPRLAVRTLQGGDLVAVVWLPLSVRCRFSLGRFEH